MKKIIFLKMYELEDTLRDSKLFSPIVGQEGDLFILQTEEKPINHFYNHSIFHFSRQGKKKYRIPCDKPYFEVQRMSNYWLFLDGYPDNDLEKNMAIYSDEGKNLYRLAVGNGVSDWQVDRNNHIWLTYSEVGVFGKSEISQNGLVCLNRNGEIIEVPLKKHIRQGKLPAMIDGTALNAMENGNIWFNYDSGGEYCLVRFKEGKINNFINKLRDNMQPIKWITQLSQTLIIGDSLENIYTINLEQMDSLEQLLPFDLEGQMLNFEWLGAKDQTIWGIGENKIYVCVNH